MYEVVHKVETGDFCLIIWFSNWALPIVLLKSPEKTVVKFLCVHLTFEKPHARSTSLSCLTRSVTAKKRVARASLTTSTPSIAAAATGTGLA